MGGIFPRKATAAKLRAIAVESRSEELIRGLAQIEVAPDLRYLFHARA